MNSGGECVHDFDNSGYFEERDRERESSIIKKMEWNIKHVESVNEREREMGRDREKQG